MDLGFTAERKLYGKFLVAAGMYRYNEIQEEIEWML